MTTRIKISQLPAASTPLTGNEIMTVVQGGVTKKISSSEINDLIVSPVAAAKTAAETAATNAAGSATSAAGSATLAASQVTTAQTAATNSASSATSSAASATLAQEWATKTSGEVVTGQGYGAKKYAQDAASSAASVSSSVTGASDSATAAAVSEANALSYKNSAQSSANTATSKATEAATSAASANASEANALAYKNIAETASNTANTKADIATTQAGIATSEALTATNKAAEALASANSASSSMVAAESARDQTLAAFDSFDDRYLGAKSLDPLGDNDGNPLVAGALYYCTATGSEGMRVYTGTSWVVSYVSGSGVLAAANNLSDIPNPATARTNLGLAAVAATGDYADLINKPSSFSGSYTDLTDKPTLFSGSYTDLSNKPTIPTVPTTVSSFTNDAGYLTSFTETDPVFAASAAYGVTTTKLGNWDTAYSWGNHASAGYLTTSSASSTYQPLDADLTAIAGLAGTTGILKKTAANTWSLDTSTYLTDITSGQVTTALGYTPYNSTNPSGYITSSGTAANVSGTVAIANGGTGSTTASAALTALGAYAATNPSGYTTNTGTVTSVATSGAITGGTITSTGTISHSTADGYLHVPATSTTNNGKVLTAGATAGSLSWTTPTTGTVTSVGMTVPTGLTIAGSPVTSSGTLAVTLTSGYSIPTTANQTNWTTAYGWGNHASAGYLASSTAASTYAALSGATFTGAVVLSDQQFSRAMLKDNGYVYFNSGTTNALNYTNGSHQRWTPSTGAQTLSITNWPPSGNLGELLIEGVNLGAATITWPTINWIKADGTTTTTFSSNGVTLQSSGTDWVFLWTRDAGTTIYGKVVR